MKTRYILSAIGLSLAAIGGAGAAQNPAALSSGDQHIVIDMAQANMAEIDTARLALSKGSSDAVKKFAQMMVDDHTKALADVRQLAQSKGVTLPTTVDAAHRAEADKLNKLSGASFDKAYLADAGVGDHTKVRDALKKYQADAKDADVKALAAKMLPTVEQHLAMAKTAS